MLNSLVQAVVKAPRLRQMQVNMFIDPSLPVGIISTEILKKDFMEMPGFVKLFVAAFFKNLG